MTPFMVRVAELLEDASQPDVDPVVRPAVRESHPKPVPVGADEQVALRALAEQLVAEANAVLSASADRIELDDHLVDGQLGFTMRFAGRGALVRTRFGSERAFGELLGVGGSCSRPVELADAGELQNLILLLLSAHPAPPREN